ncbi:nucleotidyltransferase domain-containing protein [Allorhizocola rhizosphaerae]|uniref:nucleotidyltransferase domain-containing protein n=1 Tax=Allorhizocola rhizosphaerae TaxID=1872709 RepID=UPI001FEACCCD|nr:nucleotidyltransferase domain-containing protein [Allorhizocola rhizosphaerae]
MGHTVYACVVGSRAYGLAQAESDTDRRGVYLAPTELFWGLDKPPSHVDGPAEEQFSWELERCCDLALQANPTVLECLWSPIVEQITPVGSELLELRQAFLSRRVAQSYGGYARDQFQRLEASRRKSNRVKWKQAMHMLRLLLAGAHVLRTGQILVDVSDHREDLLVVKRGERSWEEIQQWSSLLEDQLRDAAGKTMLPDEPDRNTVNDFLIRTRRAQL